MIDEAARRELEEMAQRWVDYLSAPSEGITECRRELRDFLARHSVGEAAESEDCRDKTCCKCEREVTPDNVVYDEVGSAMCRTPCYEEASRVHLRPSAGASASGNDWPKWRKHGGSTDAGSKP